MIDASEILDLAHRQIAELKQQVAELTAELATDRASLASLGREFIELYNNLDNINSSFHIRNNIWSGSAGGSGASAGGSGDRLPAATRSTDANRN